MEDREWNEAILGILRKDSHYGVRAYDFVNKSVEYAIGREARGSRPSGNRHVSGSELVRGVLEYAVSVYSVFVCDVFRYWNLQTGRDVGNVVYNMIDAGLLSAGPNDAIEDFDCADDLIFLAGEILRRSRASVPRVGDPAPALPALD